MKKLLLLLLIAPILGFGQVLTDVFYVWQKYDDVNDDGRAPIINTSSDEHFLVVPNNKIWAIQTIQNYHYRSTSEGWITSNVSGWHYAANGNYKTVDLYIHSNPAINDEFISSMDYGEGNKMYVNYLLGDLIPSGTKFFYFTGTNQKSLLKIYEYSLDSNSLSYNEPETIQNNSNTPVLFPNPTSSLLALNSDKEYDIEVYDMAGNKVMALTGNTIDMSHLSSATYIVKALDKVDNEEVSYKVVKN